MDNFKIIYQILKILENAMDIEEFDSSVISPESLKITNSRFNAIMAMIIDEGYVNGAMVVRAVGIAGVKMSDIRISLKGLEYLNDNSFMKKAANIAKGVTDLIP